MGPERTSEEVCAFVGMSGVGQFGLQVGRSKPPPPPPPPPQRCLHPPVSAFRSMWTCNETRLRNLHQEQSFHGIVTEYADGGELSSYLEPPEGTAKIITNEQGFCSFAEPRARFLFRQIMRLLRTLHHPPPGEPAFYHGDLKDGNLVIDGSTVKLIDYGSLCKV